MRITLKKYSVNKYLYNIISLPIVLHVFNVINFYNYYTHLIKNGIKKYI